MRFLLDHDRPRRYRVFAGDTWPRGAQATRGFAEDRAGPGHLRLAGERDCVLITCNRDDFLAIAGQVPNAGLVILIRRRTRAQERAALVRLLDNAGESGLRGNINFA